MRRPVTSFLYRLRWVLAALGGLLATGPARAQAPAWNAAIVGSLDQLGGTSYAYALAPDASGNVLVTGSFTGRVAFGGTVLTSAGASDAYLAKYVVATNNWAWAVRAGGTGADYGRGVAVSGGSVYVTGTITNDRANGQAVTFGAGSAQHGAGASVGPDVFVAKYTDTGTTAAFNWSQVAGGASADYGNAVAVSGSSVYVTGSLFNSATDNLAVRFGGSGATAGTVVQPGTSATGSADLFVARYVDNGSTASVAWVQVAGGSGFDAGTALAVSGSSVYVAGTLTNDRADASAVRLGGSGTVAGTVAQLGASTTSSSDLLLAKYQDNGATASVVWSQVGGGSGADVGTALAVSSTTLYVAGTFYNSRADASAVRFGGTGSTAGTVVQAGASTSSSRDVVLAKYTDNGPTAALGWTQVAGGTADDFARALVAAGGGVYLAGTLNNSTTDVTAVRFGGSGTVAGTVVQAGAGAGPSDDLFVARYVDQGATARVGWTQLAGSPVQDGGEAVAVSNLTVCVGGQLNRSASVGFGTASGAPVQATVNARAVVAQLNPATGDWVAVAATANGGSSGATATASDEQGNVYVAGYFEGVVAFGSTVLTSLGENDFFVAKYLPASGTWAWATSGGGTDYDFASSIAVQGGSVYVAGYLTNNAANANGVLLGGTGPGSSTVQVNGASTVASPDQLLARYQDTGSSASLAWTQVAGGSSDDFASGVAVSGTSVYVTGHLTNNRLNASSVVFGGSGTTAGTVRQNGASTANLIDFYLAKYTDQGSSASLGWVQVGGGTGPDTGYGVAVSGSSVYATGSLFNDAANSAGVLFGGSGTTTGTSPQPGATATASDDLLLAKYQDNGRTASLVWTQVGGGTDSDRGTAVAVSGSSLYVAGSLTNTRTNATAAVFGGSGPTAGTSPQYGASSAATADLLLARYTDNGATGTFAWSQVAGGTGYDYANAVAVRGSNVYVGGQFTNNAANANSFVLGGSGTTLGTVGQPGISPVPATDLLLARYTDNGATGSYVWHQVAGGSGYDRAAGFALSGQQVYVAGLVALPATFGPVALAGPAEATLAVLGRLTDPTLPLATQAVGTAVGLTLYPNPAPGGAARLTGATPGQAVQVLDALGRRVATATADATGAAALGGLAPGLYLVRAGTGTVRLAVE